jgi:[acyl-carrier-protein] S-malonyltransferase
MAQAYLFPGQGSQFSGMGKILYDTNILARQMFEQANALLGFNIAEIMFNGTDEDLKKTNVTQPAVFLHSIIAYKTLAAPRPEMVAGHSLGEFTALVANHALSFEDGVKLVSIRAKAMQKACEATPSSMAAVMALADEQVEQICTAVQNETGEIVVPANYNCPGQLVISGSVKGVEIACERMKAAGAKRALVLPVGGAFHSPFMLPAKQELAAAIEATTFNIPSCPVYQNVAASPIIEPALIKNNLIEQLTGAVKWTQSVQAMILNGATHFKEVGPGKVLQGLVMKINKEMILEGVS